MGSSPTWQYRKTLNSPASMYTPNLRLDIEWLPLKKTWKVAEQLLYHKWWKGHTEMSRRGRDMSFPQFKSWPNNPQLGRIPQIQSFSQSFFQRSKGLKCSTRDTPALGICNREVNFQNIWLWKPLGLISRSEEL